MLCTRLTAFMLIALSSTVLPAQDNTAANPPSASRYQARPDYRDFPIQPPPVIHLCIASCFPILWDKGHYIIIGPSNTSIYTVELFTRNSIIMHRTDKGHFPLTATLTGQISDDGNSMVNTRLVWTSGNSGSGPFTAKWGSEMDDDAVARQQRLLHIPCDASSGVTIAEAEDRAEQLLELGDMPATACWLRIGATQGDAQAQGMLAIMLYSAVGGVPQDIPGAAMWAEKSSAQHYYLGEHLLAKMYATGKGKPKDPDKAKFWQATYEKDKLALDRVQEQAKEAQRQHAQAQAQQNAAAAMLMLQIFAGAFSADSEPTRKSAIVCSAGYGAICAQ